VEEVSVLIERAQAGDSHAREVLIEKNLGLVHHIVRRFGGRGYDMEDLFQIGSIGLIKAIDKFDLNFDVRFSTYAVPMITGEIKRFLRDDGPVKVSRTLKENGWKIQQAAQRLAHRNGRDATLEEIAEETGLSREEIVMAMEANVEVESLYKTVYQSDGNEIQLLDRLAYNDVEKEQLLDHLLLKQLLEKLEEKEQRLIRMRYFENRTQNEVAAEMGISQVQVSRMEKRILLRMRRLAG
jgi:RNA polymerase sporulation-specific sigma factor